MADDAHDSKAEKPIDDKEAQSSGTSEMKVKVYSPYKVYFEGPAVSMSAESLTGPFDILPKHHNFITLLSPCDLVVRTSNNEEKFRIDGGVMHVKADDVVVFLDV